MKEKWIKSLKAKPQIGKNTFIAPGAQLIGEVKIGPYSSIWFGTIMRADINKITIGAHSNIQDGCILHVADDLGIIVGDYVTVGHGVNLHACTVENGSLIGMGAIILNGAKIGEGAVVGAGAIVSPKTKIPPQTLALGVPAKVVRKLSKKETKENLHWAKKYQKLAQCYS